MVRRARADRTRHSAVAPSTTWSCSTTARQKRSNGSGENADDLAAVIVEPVQSRHPGCAPIEFLRAFARSPTSRDVAFVFDEVVTGFRVHPGGMQALFGIRADLATYGKVVGGGMPIGILAGKRHSWTPSTAASGVRRRLRSRSRRPTFFAGTFVRHPLVAGGGARRAPAPEAQGPALQERIAKRAADLAETLNGIFARHGLKAKAECYSSFLYFSLHADGPLAGLLFYHLR